MAFGTDARRCNNENMEMGGHRKIGRPKRRWSDVIRRDMEGERSTKRSARPENVD